MSYIAPKRLLFILISCLFSLNCFAQDSTIVKTTKYIFKTHLPGYILGRYEAALEVSKWKKISFQFSGGLIKRSETGNSNSRPYELYRNGYTGLLQIKFYAKDQSLMGTYVSPFIGLSKVQSEFIDNSCNYNSLTTDTNLSHSRLETTINLGFLIGHQLIHKNGFTVDLFAGPQVFDNTTSDVSYNVEELNASSPNDGKVTIGNQLFTNYFRPLNIENEKSILSFRVGVSIGYTF